jgi:tetratricopeptide (TPR) repeat protein
LEIAMPTVFLSYRRSDSAKWCRRLSDHLSLRFGDDIVFRDVDDLQPGMRWRREINAALHGARVVLVLIGPQWFAARQRQRLADPKDVLRQEIATALSSPRRKVVPVLLGGTSLPDANALPRPLRPLCEWQACSLRDRQWRDDVERLVERLRQVVPGLGGLTLEQVHQRLLNEQERYFELLDESPKHALAAARATMRTLNRVCPRYPQDTDLQLTRGYCHKNIAMALQRINRLDEANLALNEAERTFRTAARERPRDAGAWNGLGSVAALRGQLKRALRYVEKALKLAPAYPAALQDRRQLLAALGRG